MRISVIMPNLDAGNFLLEAVESLATQKGFQAGRDFELIIADDGSTDEATLGALRAARMFDWCRLVHTSGRRGAAHARNLAVRHARGEWLAFLDSDDLWTEDALLVRWEAHLRFPFADCIATDYSEFVERSDAERKEPGQIESSPRRRLSVAAAFEAGAAISLEKPFLSFLGATPVHIITVLLRRSVFADRGGFLEALPRAEDLHLWLRVAIDSTFVFVPEITAFYRNRPGSLTSDEVRLMRQTAQCYKELLTRDLPRSWRKPIRGCIAEAYRNEAYAARVERDWRAAGIAALRLLWQQPLNLDSWMVFAKSLLPARQAFIARNVSALRKSSGMTR